MRRMFMWQLVLIFVCFLINQDGWSQKKWDGEGGDSLWNNPMNWHPNGVPDASDSVVLDNQWILHTYKVYFSDSLQTHLAFSIKIQASNSKQIHLVLPASNTASPSLTLTSMDTAICIGDGGIFLNNSGANAGNPILLSGKIKIMNGGKYVHQTQRGNASLVSNLVVSPETRKGVFEFNVPGNSAYIISTSGRTFGSLVLNGQQTVRKTYTSSGSNKLNIEGDLIVHEQATLISNLTNTISIGGDLIVKGRLYLNPVSSDTTGRDMITSGSANTMVINGQFNQGIHFRKWIIAGGYEVNLSTIHLDQPTGEIQIKTGSHLQLGNSVIKGVGRLIIDSNVHIYSSATAIFDSDTLSNIQLTDMSIHPATKFSAYGSQSQKTGDRFPNTISTLHMNKTEGKLTLSRPLVIDDSLLLTRGKMMLDDSIRLIIKDYTDKGNDSSYVIGTIIHESDKKIHNFPLGIDSIFTPAQIKRESNNTNPYEMSVKRLKEDDLSQITKSPVKHLISPVYWKVNIPNYNSIQDQVQLQLHHPPSNPLACIVQYDSINQYWVPVSTLPIAMSLDTLSTDTSRLPIGVFTIGQLEPVVLALNSITLNKTYHNAEINLKWTVNDDENAIYYTIETAEEDGNFKPIDTIMAYQQNGISRYSRLIKRKFTSPILFRICGTDQDGNKHYSNVVHARGSSNKPTIYPNPTTNELRIKTTEKIKAFEIIDAKGSNIYSSFNIDKTIPVVAVQQLKAGNYFLRLHYSNGNETISFTKQ
ncbi:MAG: hypothetical protein RL642_1277 [Bacteroidota bacterium]